MNHSHKTPIKPMADEIAALDKLLSKKPTYGFVPFLIGATCAGVVLMAYTYISHL
ncbi:hypothetical protein D3C75_1229380 [compost metagenome]